MNSCNHFQNMLDAYLEGSLSDEENLFMEGHDISCKHCHKELLFRQSVYDTLHTLPKLPVSPDFTANLNARLDAIDAGNFVQDQRPHPTIRRFPLVYHWKKYSAVAACLVLAVLVRIDMGNIIDKTNRTPDLVDDYMLSDSIIPNDTETSDDTSRSVSGFQNNPVSQRTEDIGAENTAVPSTAPTTAQDKPQTHQASRSTTKPSAAASSNLTKATAAPRRSAAPVQSGTAATAKPTEQVSASPAENTISEAPPVSSAAPQSDSSGHNPEVQDTGIMLAEANADTQTSELPSSMFITPVSGDDEVSPPSADQETASPQRTMGSTVSKSGDFTMVNELEGHTVAGVNMSSAMNSFVIVPSKSETQVKEILSKYLAAADSSGNTDYFLTPTGYQSFIDDLKENNIDFKCTFDFPGNAPVLVKLIVT